MNEMNENNNYEHHDEGAPHDILILGCCYTPEHETNYEGPLYRYDEIDSKLVDSLKDKDVYIEHDIVDDKGQKRNPIGKVVDAYINSDGNVMSFLHITGDPIASSLIPHGLVKDENGRRYYNDLSLGHGVIFDIDKNKDNIKIEEKIPEEISIVRTGDRPRTHIKDYWLLPHNTESQKVRQMIPDFMN